MKTALFAMTLMVLPLNLAAAPNQICHQEGLHDQQPVAFTHGVASGDVRARSAVLWTRVDGAASLRAELATDPDFKHVRRTRTVRTGEDHDFTARVVVRGLRPGTTYYYRWQQGDNFSTVGTFKTAPERRASSGVRFAWSGDADGTRLNGVPFFNNFEVFDAVRGEAPDFFVYLGDTIYADSVVRNLAGLGPAVTVDDYRQAYKTNLEYDFLQTLRAGTSIYTMWDDHEVRNDFDGQTVDPTLYANGRQAFLEYSPVGPLVPIHDDECAADPLMRVFHWGRDIDIIIPDERSCRSADVEVQCQGDPAPTLPPQLRARFGVPELPPPGCLEALYDPSRTMLGARQKEAFKAALQHSRAKYKFVVNELAIQQFYALPYDRWEGYAAEREEILNFIREQRIENVVFLTTDNHATLVNEVFIDRFTDPEPVAEEFVTGPIATFTLQEEIVNSLGPEALTAFHGLLNLVDMDCRQLDAESYGTVAYDPQTGVATITIKDDTGAVMADQLDPAKLCVKELGL